MEGSQLPVRIPNRGERAHQACVTCRRHHLKCVLASPRGGSKTKACARCTMKGIVCEYLETAEEEDRNRMRLNLSNAKPPAAAASAPAAPISVYPVPDPHGGQNTSSTRRHWSYLADGSHTGGRSSQTPASSSPASAQTQTPRPSTANYPLVATPHPYRSRVAPWTPYPTPLPAGNNRPASPGTQNPVIPSISRPVQHRSVTHPSVPSTTPHNSLTEPYWNFPQGMPGYTSVCSCPPGPCWCGSRKV